MKLTDKTIKAAKPKLRPYKLTDGAGLYLHVQPRGGRYWRLDYRFNLKRRTLALGVYPEISLAAARELKTAAIATLANGTDPSLAKRDQKRIAKFRAANTFQAISEEWLAQRDRELSQKYLKQLSVRLKQDIYPWIGSRIISEIEAPHILDALRKIENRGVKEIAIRMRQTCGQIFRYAIATGRAQRNPTSDLREALKPPGRKKPRCAMPMEQFPEFLNKLETIKCNPRTRIALQLIVFTFVRTSELLGAK